MGVDRSVFEPEPEEEEKDGLPVPAPNRDPSSLDMLRLR